jgi:HD-like signal output (HDOD) protein
LGRRPLEDAIAGIRRLPTLPTVVAQILNVAADPDSSALDLARYIAADQSLSANLLRLVNSAYYGFPRQITSITTAIVMAGFSEVRNLALTATAFGTIPKSRSGFDRTQLWRHSVASAIAADRLAKLLQQPSDGAYFVTGLMHDIGKVVLDVLYPEEFSEAVQEAKRETRPLHEMEQERFDLDHAGAGALLAEHWDLPEQTTEAIRCHHTVDQCILDAQLTSVTALADFVTYEVELGDTSNGLPPPFPKQAAEVLRATEENCAEVCQELVRNRTKVEELIGVLEET